MARLETYCDVETPEERLKRKEAERQKAMSKYGWAAVAARRAKDEVEVHSWTIER